jgi:hypothetical protein
MALGAQSCEKINYHFPKKMSDDGWQMSAYFWGVSGSGLENRSKLLNAYNGTEKAFVSDRMKSFAIQSSEMCEKTLKILHDMKISEELNVNKSDKVQDLDDDIPDLVCGACDLIQDKCRCESQLCKHYACFTEDCTCSGGKYH